VSLEKTDFKKLSLSVAPGPFDFFTVDVSFVAGRNMLRGLAFRLRPGAEGVVLVKPQFELPSHLVRDGKVEAPALRQRALDAFTAKATALGFTVLATHDSPVAGASGTVEMLAHLRFDGRPDSLPQPGERRPARSNAKAKSARPDGLRWFAVAAPGLEAALRDELDRLPGVADVRAVEGGVELAGPLSVGMAANLWSRIATRVVVRLGEVRAREFAPLRRALAKLPWARFVPPERPLRVEVTAHHCRLYHTGALAETVALAVEDCVGKLPARRDEDEAEGRPLTRILLRGEDDRFTASADASGELLHRRGWRTEAGAAPLRETLAAGILALCEYDPRAPLVDPMCGSGTFAIEAAAVAAGIPPGRGRGFAFETWPCHDPAVWQGLQGQATSPSSGALVHASDRDGRAVEMARRNAARAGVENAVEFRVAALGQAVVPDELGLVVVNPPYGRRLGQRAQALRLGRDIGQTLARRYRGWRAGVLCPDPQFVAAVTAGTRKPPAATHALRNGGLRVTLGLWRL
jgi:putative N6-adenine-specific DNA methylase